MDQHAERLARARISLEGLSIGDALGGSFEMASLVRMKRYLEKHKLPPPRRYTDDTQMALSIYEILRLYQGIDQDALAQSFADHFVPQRGYGMGARSLLSRIQKGGDWRELAPAMFRGSGSFGNGSAMRVTPVGAYFADDLGAAAHHAKLSAVVTHSHPEGAAGAIAIAIGAAVAHQMKIATEQPDRKTFIERVLPHIPDSQVREGVQLAHTLPDDCLVSEAVEKLGNGHNVSCQDTVPFVLWCAGTHLDDYEQALTLTASGGGDVDTTCAMVGGIVVMYIGIDGIPETWREFREPLPDWPFEEKDHDA